MAHFAMGDAGVYACGTMLVFIFLHRFVAADIQRRSDAWLSGEVEVLGDVAEHTPKNALYGRVVGEIAELASKEVPNRMRRRAPKTIRCFFCSSESNGALQLWAGPGNSEPFWPRSDERPFIPTGQRTPCEGNRDSLSRGHDEDR